MSDDKKLLDDEKQIVLEKEGLGFDYIFLRLPQVSGYQACLFLMSSWAWICYGMVTVGSVITQARPDHRCKTILDGTAYNLTFEEGKSFAPEDKCQMYDIDWAQQCPGAVKFEDLEKCFEEKKLNQSELIPCENGYESVFDKSQFESTVTTDWQLVCSNRWVDTWLTVSVMAGLLVGVFSFGPVIDRIGRRKTIFVACIGLAVIQLPLVFLTSASSVWIYAALRFGSSFFVIAAATAGFVYTTEIVGQKYRTWFGMGNQLLRAFGVVTLSIIGSFIHNWHQQMMVFVAVPLVFVFIFFWIVPMSNAWLYATKKFDEGRVGVKHFAEKVNVDVDEGFLDELQYSVEQKMSSGAAVTYTQADLFKRPGMKKTTFIELTQWFSTKMVYYGLSLSAGGLGGNVLVTNLIYGFVDFVCYIVLPKIIDVKKIGRRGGTMLMMTISAIGCFGTAFFTYKMMGEEHTHDHDSQYYVFKKTCAFIAKFGISGTFGLVYVYTGELYPTPIRGIAVGLCSAGGRIGGILCPLVNSTATSLPWLPYAIYGSMSIFQVITVTRLPETLGKPMLTSIDEAEEFYANPEGKNSEKE